MDVAAPAPPVDEREPVGSEPVPLGVRTRLEPSLSADLFDTRIVRNADVASEARSLRARAFTRDGQVHLPTTQGPLDRPVARSLVAHELTHVAQQQRLGDDRPDEESPAGRVLEAHAVAAERGALAREQPFAWPGAATSPLPAPRVAAGRGGLLPPTPASPPRELHRPAPAAPPAAGRAASMAPQRAPEDEPATPATVAPASPAGGAGGGGGGGDMDQLAEDLFPKIRGLLLEELRDFRERSGTLVDQ